MRVGALELDVRLEGGERPVALVGPNGSGKSTLLRTIAGAYRPSRGTIAVGGDVLFDSRRGIDLPPEKRRVGYVPQGYGLFPHLRVVDNVRFGLAGASRRDNGARAAALAVLEQLGAGHLDQRWPETLSGGERQRVALARALVIEPRMLLLDEPLAALDAAARRAMRRRLADRLAESGVPALVVTHDIHDIVALDAEVWGDRGGKDRPAGLGRRPRRPPRDRVRGGGLRVTAYGGFRRFSPALHRPFASNPDGGYRRSWRNRLSGPSLHRSRGRLPASGSGPSPLLRTRGLIAASC